MFTVKYMNSRGGQTACCSANWGLMDAEGCLLLLQCSLRDAERVWVLRKTYILASGTVISKASFNFAFTRNYILTRGPLTWANYICWRPWDVVKSSGHRLTACPVGFWHSQISFRAPPTLNWYWPSCLKVDKLLSFDDIIRTNCIFLTSLVERI